MRLTNFLRFASAAVLLCSMSSFSGCEKDCPSPSSKAKCGTTTPTTTTTDTTKPTGNS